MLPSRRFKMTKDIIVGKHVLESLSLGMYSNPYDILREYIQNATDAIDNACDSGVLDVGQGKIVIEVGKNSEFISIRDNGIGLPVEHAAKKLGDVGNSDKNYEENRGFRGIGRLGGLGYADVLSFITSAKGENKRTIIKWDCIFLRELLSPRNIGKEDIISVIQKVMSSEQENEDVDEHYFEVRLEGIRKEFLDFFTSEKIDEYLSKVAPVDFNAQHFPYSDEIKNYFLEKKCPLSTYNICHKNRNMPIYKPYTRTLGTGMQERTRNKDYVKRIEYVYGETANGQPLYIGWLAITDFSGQINEESLQGIRLRKGNILVGDKNTFAKFFPSEGEVANKMFAGEIHILHPDIIPNAKRDDFEPGEIYQEMGKLITKWAGFLNKTYRRGTSEATSVMRNIDRVLAAKKDYEAKISSGGITSDTKRDQFLSNLEEIDNSLNRSKKKLKSFININELDKDRKDILNVYINKADECCNDFEKLKNEIIDSDYSTKKDIPSSYSRQERKVYQRIIEVIDRFFVDEPDIASKLREAIKEELSIKKK